MSKYVCEECGNRFFEIWDMRGAYRPDEPIKIQIACGNCGCSVPRKLIWEELK